ncbi:hypothetical protein [Nostoc sp. JL33]|uniref:hypothetical protein n=1 Tax=Nostoc sp. JL33 TaxID=2815396 RepID=UPI0025E27751|nr:hypothetical protein [Nostoc sp. JL33]
MNQWQSTGIPEAELARLESCSDRGTTLSGGTSTRNGLVTNCPPLRFARELATLAHCVAEPGSGDLNDQESSDRARTHRWAYPST